MSLPAGRIWSQSQHTASPLCWPSRKPLPKPKLHQTCGSCQDTAIAAWASQDRGLTREGFGAAADHGIFKQFCKGCRGNSLPQSQAATVTSTSSLPGVLGEQQPATPARSECQLPVTAWERGQSGAVTKAQSPLLHGVPLSSFWHIPEVNFFQEAPT